MTNDEDLMLRAAGGDMDAFEELVERHHRAALNTAYRFLSDQSLAEDVAQEAFLRILAGASRYRPLAAFRTYLFNVVWHLCIDAYRKSRAVRMPSDAAPADERDGPVGEAVRGELRRSVRAAVERLPERQRMAVVLKHFEGLSYGEIAQVLECSTRAVDSLLIRAKRHLKEELGGLL